MNGAGHSSLMRRSSAITFSTGFVRYFGCSRIAAAQNSQFHGQPREVCTVSRL